jgi:hypothetical protein
MSTIDYNVSTHKTWIKGLEQFLVVNLKSISFGVQQKQT